MRSVFAASILSVAASLGLSAFPGVGLEADAQAVNPGETIRSILVEGNQRIEDRTVQLIIGKED